MPITVALHEKALTHLGDRLDALDLDITVVPYTDDGTLLINGTSTAPDQVDIDYLWLSYHNNAGEAKKTAFQTALNCRSVNVLQTFNAGLDDPHYRQYADKGIRICNSSAQAVAISEFVMAQAMALIHPIDLQRTQQQRREWKVTPFRELSRMNWLIVGFGPIGQQVAQRVKAFGASVNVVRRSRTSGPNVDAVGTLEDMQNFLPQADVIVLACPLNNETRGLADDRFFSAVKKDAVLINIARGGVVNDRALLTALDAGQLQAAVLDVFHEEPLPTDNPLWTHPKVRMTPHTSFSGDGVRDRWDALFLDNVARFVRGDTLLHEVNPRDIV